MQQMKYLVNISLLLFFLVILMENTLNNLEILDNIKFMIKYCDTFLDYCHEENLSIDGNIAGEIVDSLTDIEEIIENPDEIISNDELKSLYEDLSDIYYGLTTINDIKLFNNIHIVYSMVLSQTRNILEKELDIEIEG